jgi:uncharacterized protein (UPF0335 family)
MNEARGPQTIDPAGNRWPRADGSLVDCREKLRVLQENHAELAQCLQDCFEDAALMGVDARALRQLLHGMVEDLREPGPAGDAVV